MEYDSQEKVPQDALPLWRYYYACEHTGNYGALVSYLDTYLEDQFREYGLELSLFRFQHEDGYVDYEFFETDQVQGYEQFLLAPLRLGMPIVDALLPENKLASWYEWAAVVATGKWGESQHDATCLQQQQRRIACMCAYSVNCPLRATRELLLKGIKHPDFTSDEYRIDHERVEAILLARLKAAMSVDLVTRKEAEAHIHTYTTLYSSANPPKK